MFDPYKWHVLRKWDVENQTSNQVCWPRWELVTGEPVTLLWLEANWMSLLFCKNDVPGEICKQMLLHLINKCIHSCILCHYISPVLHVYLYNLSFGTLVPISSAQQCEVCNQYLISDAAEHKFPNGCKQYSPCRLTCLLLVFVSVSFPVTQIDICFKYERFQPHICIYFVAASLCLSMWNFLNMFA